MPRPDPWQLAATTVVWLGGLSVIALWELGGGVLALAELSAETLASLGRVTGLVSAYLMLLQVLLMARVPLFERGFGRAGMTRMHRLTGIWSVSLLAAHLVTIVVAYALQDGVNIMAESWDLLWHYPGILAATIGVLALAVVMATSTRRARRKLRYEAWHLLHLYAYFGVALAIPHMLLTGNDFVSNPAATAYWWALWVATAACVLACRVARPLWMSWRHGLRVAEVVADGAKGVTVRMRGRRLASLGTQAGQHFVWRFLDGPGWSRGHPLSLSAAPAGNELQISARIVGDGTARLARLRPGTRVLFEGPYGRETNERRTKRGLFLLGAGAGVAPLVGLLEAAAFAPGEAVLVTREHRPEDLMLVSAISRLIAERGLVHYALNGPRVTRGADWLPRQYAEWSGTEMLRQLSPGDGPRALTNCDVFLCGPAAWMASVRRELRRAGVRREQIHCEPFSVD